jgi:alcohol dehydrogenase class IV
MLVGAAMGAIAFQKDLGATHSMAHPLSTLFGMHHGTANAVCLPAVMRFNAQRKPGVYRRVGVACGLDVLKKSDAEADAITIDFLSNFLVGLDLKPGLSSFGIKSSDVEALAAQAIEDGCHQTNPVPVTLNDFRALYVSAL